MVTIRDVATDAGVSRSTVSYVLTGNKRLSPATVARVRASMAKLGYRPDLAARASGRGRTGVLGLLAPVSAAGPESGVEVFMHFVRAATYAARARGLDLLVMGGKDQRLGAGLLADALVVMDVQRQDPRLGALRRSGLPAVLIGLPEDRHGLSAVDLDFEAAGRAAAQHLAERGHREVALLGMPRRHGFAFAFAERFRHGFEAEAAARGLAARHLPCEPDGEGVGDWLDTLAPELPGLSGLVVLNTDALRPLLDALGRRGLVLPRDCSVLAVSPGELAARGPRPVTAVDLPAAELMARAVARVLEELAGTAEAGAVDLLPPVLRDQGSTARHVPGVSRGVYA
ncbi:LacI family DNA-binding transcriptional regulator [Streptomyces hoynatensis]|uniref:LacI family transcriptional regulator n=1 Tax=Streptomyces hoynatensis TaxID=1141874 RepID=A0A3A9Z6T4_9ACTN|nr:LacI family DNA-binding transcriptional regulator [Streptomyces hoynatensis]RKN43978.1 LacI family transcriptional regulator [Streptomyces hoynatensis]